MRNDRLAKLYDTMLHVEITIRNSDDGDTKQTAAIMLAAYVHAYSIMTGIEIGAIYDALADSYVETTTGLGQALL